VPLWLDHQPDAAASTSLSTSFRNGRFDDDSTIMSINDFRLAYKTNAFALFCLLLQQYNLSTIGFVVPPTITSAAQLLDREGLSSVSSFQRSPPRFSRIGLSIVWKALSGTAR
jgi:hypothetical protein